MKCTSCNQESDYSIKIDNKFCCPHCSEEKSRVCPACNQKFKRAKSKDNKRFCPHCKVEIYYPRGRLNGKTILAIDKETSEKIVRLLEEDISKKDEVVFTFEHGERTVQLVHAYALLDRSKTFLSKQQDDLGLNPHEFILEVVQEVLEDKFWSSIELGSLAMFRNHVGKFAQDLFRKKKLDRTINEARKAAIVDYNGFKPVWN